MKYYNEKTKELDDNRILRDIRCAATLFEDGSIIESRDVMVDIINAIDAFTSDYFL